MARYKSLRYNWWKRKHVYQHYRNTETVVVPQNCYCKGSRHCRLSHVACFCKISPQITPAIKAYQAWQLLQLTFPISKQRAKKAEKRERQRLRKGLFWSCSVGRESVWCKTDGYVWNTPLAKPGPGLWPNLDLPPSKSQCPLPCFLPTLSPSSLTLLIHSFLFLIFLLFQACCAASVPHGKHTSIITNPSLCKMKINNCFSPPLPSFTVIDAKWSVASKGLLAKSEGLLHLFLNWYANLFPQLGIYILEKAGLQNWAECKQTNSWAQGVWIYPVGLLHMRN